MGAFMGISESETSEFLVGGLRNPASVTDWAMELAHVTCPTCFESFELAMPHPDETPAEVDYDCEVCCRPMVIVFTGDDAYARGLAD